MASIGLTSDPARKSAERSARRSRRRASSQLDYPFGQSLLSPRVCSSPYSLRPRNDTDRNPGLTSPGLVDTGLLRGASVIADRQLAVAMREREQSGCRTPGTIAIRNCASPGLRALSRAPRTGSTQTRVGDNARSAKKADDHEQ
jgi:hypothetical protein